MRSKRVIGEFGTGTSTSLQLFELEAKVKAVVKGTTACGSRSTTGTTT